jgi:hypothetical protein
VSELPAVAARSLARELQAVRAAVRTAVRAAVRAALLWSDPSTTMACNPSAGSRWGSVEGRSCWAAMEGACMSASVAAVKGSGRSAGGRMGFAPGAPLPPPLVRPSSLQRASAASRGRSRPSACAPSSSGSLRRLPARHPTPACA